MSNIHENVDEITEMLAASPLVAIPMLGCPVQTPSAVSDEQMSGVLMAIDDITRQLNKYDQFSHYLKNNGMDAEAQEVKDMANIERKHKVRLREILKVLGND